MLPEYRLFYAELNLIGCGEDVGVWVWWRGCKCERGGVGVVEEGWESRGRLLQASHVSVSVGSR